MICIVLFAGTYLCRWFWHQSQQNWGFTFPCGTWNWWGNANTLLREICVCTHHKKCVVLFSNSMFSVMPWVGCIGLHCFGAWFTPSLVGKLCSLLARYSFVVLPCYLEVFAESWTFIGATKPSGRKHVKLFVV